MKHVDEITRRLMERTATGLALRPIPAIKCADGYTVSVQAHSGAYCRPRDDYGPWDLFELGFPSAADDLIADYAESPDRPTDTVYGYVPAEIVDALIEKHGGISL